MSMKRKAKSDVGSAAPDEADGVRVGEEPVPYDEAARPSVVGLKTYRPLFRQRSSGNTVALRMIRRLRRIGSC